MAFLAVAGVVATSCFAGFTVVVISDFFKK